MAAHRLTAVLRRLRERGAECAAGVPDDGQLLERFVRQRDEEAFGTLVARHGPMVLDVCRRVLFDPTAAEDSFQVTFLVLVRKASSIRKGELLGNWLYGVAYRTASRAKVEAARRHARESTSPSTAKQTDPLAEMTVREFMAALDDELSRLPSRFRTPLVLCYLEGRARDEAVRELGCSLATLDRRLKAGRELLRTRLEARGLTMSGALLGAVLCERAGTAAVPASLVSSTVKLAAGVGVRAEVAVLTEGVLKAMSLNKLKVVMVVFVVLAAVGAGIGGFGFRTQGADRTPDQGCDPAPTPEARGVPNGKSEEAKGLKLTLCADKVETWMDPQAPYGAVPVTLKLTFTNTGDKPIKLDAYALPYRLQFRCDGPGSDSVKKELEYVDQVLKPPTEKDHPVIEPGKSWSATWTPEFPGDIPDGIGTVAAYFLRKPGIYKLRMTVYDRYAPHVEGAKPGTKLLESNELEVKVLEKKPASDQDKLQGTWVAVSSEVDGKPDPDVVKKGYKLTIEGNRFTLRPELALHFPHGIFTLDTAGQPRAIDFTQTRGLPREEPALIPGIYEFDGETLKICRDISGRKRPTEFTTKPGSGRELLVFQRPAAQKAKVALEDLPDLQYYRADPYIRAAAALQDLGKDKAADALLKLTKGRDHDNQVLVLCRMLFAPKPKTQFRRPAIGGAIFLGGTGYPDWPLEPIELVDGVPFLITRGYDIGGEPEPAEGYLKYCLRNCDWNNLRFKPTDDQEKQEALKKLLASPKWKARLDDADKEFLAAQIRPEVWSESVNGLKGRLRIDWVSQGNTILPEVTAEFKNVQPTKPLTLSNRFDLDARIHDESGKEVKSEISGPLPGQERKIIPEQWGLVPASASLSYPADLRCTGSPVPSQWFPRGKAVVLILAGTQWTLPPGRYVVSARLKDRETKKLPPAATTGWKGTLTLPPVEVVVPGATKPDPPGNTPANPADEEARASEVLKKWGGSVWTPDSESGANSLVLFGYKGWLSDADLKEATVHMRKLPNLRAVSLNFTGVTDAGLASLADLPQLRELHLKATRVTDAGLAHLRKMSKLRKIDLTLTRVSEKGMAELKKALPKAEVLSSSTDKTTEEAKKLRGVWRGHRILPGNKTDEAEELFLVVAGNDLAWGIVAGPSAARSMGAGPFTLHPDSKPKNIDFEFTDGLPGNNSGPSCYLGIYRLEGDTLTLCIRPARRGDTKQPTEFSPEDERVQMYVFKREKE